MTFDFLKPIIPNSTLWSVEPWSTPTYFIVYARLLPQLLNADSATAGLVLFNIVFIFFVRACIWVSFLIKDWVTDWIWYGVSTTWDYLFGAPEEMTKLIKGNNSTLIATPLPISLHRTTILPISLNKTIIK